MKNSNTNDIEPIFDEETPDWIKNSKIDSDYDKKLLDYFDSAVFPIIKKVVEMLKEISIPIKFDPYSDSKLNLIIRTDTDQTAVFMEDGVPTKVTRRVRFMFENSLLVVFFESYAWRSLHKEYIRLGDSSKGFNIIDDQERVINSPISLEDMLTIFKWLTYNTDVTPFDADKPPVFGIKAHCRGCQEYFSLECANCKGIVFLRTFDGDMEYPPEFECVDCGEEMAFTAFLSHECGESIFPGDCEVIPLTDKAGSKKENLENLEELEELEEKSTVFNFKAPCIKCEEDVEISCMSCQGKNFTHIISKGVIIDDSYKCADCGMNIPLSFCDNGHDSVLLPKENFIKVALVESPDESIVDIIKGLVNDWKNEWPNIKKEFKESKPISGEEAREELRDSVKSIPILNRLIFLSKFCPYNAKRIFLFVSVYIVSIFLLVIIFGPLAYYIKYILLAILVTVVISCIFRK
jgi:hypothetical protein